MGLAGLKKKKRTEKQRRTWKQAINKNIKEK